MIDSDGFGDLAPAPSYIKVRTFFILKFLLPVTNMCSFELSHTTRKLIFRKEKKIRILFFSSKINLFLNPALTETETS